MEISKVFGTDNPADVFTTYVDSFSDTAESVEIYESPRRRRSPKVSHWNCDRCEKVKCIVFCYVPQEVRKLTRSLCLFHFPLALCELDPYILRTHFLEELPSVPAGVGRQVRRIAALAYEVGLVTLENVYSERCFKGRS